MIGVAPGSYKRGAALQERGRLHERGRLQERVRFQERGRLQETGRFQERGRLQERGDYEFPPNRIPGLAIFCRDLVATPPTVPVQKRLIQTSLHFGRQEAYTEHLLYLCRCP